MDEDDCFTLPFLEELDIKFKSHHTRSKLLITDCPRLKTLRVEQESKNLHMTVSNCPLLSSFTLKTTYPDLISVDNFRSLRYFEVDLSNDRCFLELDRFDKRVYKFDH